MLAEAVSVSSRGRGKIKSAGAAAIPAVAPLQSPQTIDGNVATLAILHGSQVIPAIQVKSADRAIAKITDHQGVAKRPEVRSGHRYTPGQIHMLVDRHYALDQVSVQVEGVDQAGIGARVGEAPGPVRKAI